MKKSKRIIGAVIMLVLLAGAGLYVWSAVQEPDSSSLAAPSVKVVRGNIEEVVTAQGKLEPKEYVNVGAQVSGQIQKLFVDIGDNVNIGDPIAIIDPDVYEAQLAGDEARMKTLLAQKAEQQALLEQATRTRARHEKLAAQKAIAQETADDSKTAVAIAQSKLLSLTAQIEEQQSALEKDKTNLSYTKIFAPIAGTVVTLETREGETLNANQTTPTIVQLAKLDTMTVKAQVAEADINKIRQGQAVYFTTLGGQQRRWHTTVRQILPTPEVINDVVLYNVLADIENTDRQLMANMSTQMFFVLGRAENVLSIPASALTRRMAKMDNDQGQAYEVQRKRGRALENVIIHVGLSDRTQAEVRAGLQEGDEIILPLTASPVNGKSGNPQTSRMRGMPRL